MADSVEPYEIDKEGKVSFNGEIIGIKSTIFEKIVLILDRNPAQTKYVWVWDEDGNLNKALATTPSSYRDQATVEEDLKEMMN